MKIEKTLIPDARMTKLFPAESPIAGVIQERKSRQGHETF